MTFITKQNKSVTHSGKISAGVTAYPRKTSRNILLKVSELLSLSFSSWAIHCCLQRFSMEGISNVIQNGLRHTFGNSGGEKQYLTTVIPYEKKNGPPSVEDLQILTKILRAMKEDSEKVPSLLTDYILKAVDRRQARQLTSCLGKSSNLCSVSKDNFL
ncbi:hypothetical protein STEG23_015344 [Scotinomys teguina]